MHTHRDQGYCTRCFSLLNGNWLIGTNICPWPVRDIVRPQKSALGRFIVLEKPQHKHVDLYVRDQYVLKSRHFHASLFSRSNSTNIYWSVDNKKMLSYLIRVVHCSHMLNEIYWCSVSELHCLHLVVNNCTHWYSVSGHENKWLALSWWATLTGTQFGATLTGT